jgi:small-conductance mechanosensitive channel
MAVNKRKIEEIEVEINRYENALTNIEETLQQRMTEFYHLMDGKKNAEKKMKSLKGTQQVLKGCPTDVAIAIEIAADADEEGALPKFEYVYYCNHCYAENPANKSPYSDVHFHICSVCQKIGYVNFP